MKETSLFLSPKHTKTDLNTDTLLLSSQVLYEFVFCNSEICSPFGIYTCHPRALVDPERAVTGLEIMLIVEEGEDLIDPFTLVDQVLFVPSVV